MKPKTIYLLLIICCLALFSSAKRMKNSCIDETACIKEQKTPEDTGTDAHMAEYSPVFHYIISI